MMRPMSEVQVDTSWKVRSAAIVAVVGPLICLFGPLFWNDEVFAFRDVANFYSPLFEWECREWGAGRVPLWNPYDNLGTPALADSTSSVLYPGKLIFALPLAFRTRFNLYIVAHVLLAAVAAYHVARRWESSVVGAGVCALGYALGGHVLFQYCNVVYLVGAAWLPVAVWLADAMLVQRSSSRAIALGTVLALMVLGGDPQSAYHAGLLATGHAVLVWHRERRNRHSPALPTAVGWQAWFRWRPALLATAAVVGISLAAVQILPSVLWVGRSERARYDAPRSVYEAAAVWYKNSLPAQGFQSPWQAAIRGLVGSPVAGTHAAQTYFYSVSPWRLAELIWPNVSGRMFPVHRRWLSAVPSEGGVWSPSLYCGLVTLLTAACAWRWRHGTVRDRWAMGMVVGGIAASFGWYGVGWLVHELRSNLAGAAVAEPWIGQPVGGAYWLFVVLLPGYAYFRYPAKWFVVTALGLSLLAARGTDRLLIDDRRARRFAGGIGVLSLAFAATSLVGRRAFLHWLDGAPPNDVFGPLDAQGSWRDLALAFLHATALMTLFVLVTRVAFLQRLARPGIWLLLISAADLLHANHWLLATVPATDAAVTSSLADSLNKSGSGQPAPPPRFVHANPAAWTPSTWRETSDPHRLHSVLVRQQQTLLHKYHLPHNVAAFDTPTTIDAAEFRSFLRMAGSVDPSRLAWNHAQMLGAAGVEYYLFPDPAEWKRWQSAWNNSPADIRQTGHSVVARNPANVLPRAWIVHDVRSSPRPRTADSKSLEAYLRHMWFTDAGETMRDLHRTVFVDDMPVLVNRPIDNIGRGQESCAIVRYEPQSIELHITLQTQGLIVINDFYDRGWKAAIQSENHGGWQEHEVLRVNGIFRGVRLQAGAQRVRLFYRPTSFLIGAACSVAVAMALLAMWLRQIAKTSVVRP